jgi:hypothetical protein
MTSASDFESPAFHPLISRIQQPMTRRAALLGACGLLATRVAPGVAAQEATAEPELQIEGDPDAVELLERSAEALANLKTFAFEMETVRGSSSIMAGFELKSVSGVIRRPTDLRAEVEVSIPLGDLTIEAIGLDGTFWIQDPLSDGAWMELGQMGEIQALINPDILILRAVQLVQNAMVTGNGKVDGDTVTIVEGEVDFSGLLEGFGQDSSEIANFLATEPVLVAFWIDEEDRIREVEMIGPILASETEDVVRVITLTEFNEPVEIEAPDIVATPGA